MNFKLFSAKMRRSVKLQYTKSEIYDEWLLAHTLLVGTFSIELLNGTLRNVASLRTHWSRCRNSDFHYGSSPRQCPIILEKLPIVWRGRLDVSASEWQRNRLVRAATET